ncbi:MAG: CPBP family intramembrane metalloprotease [Kouleothrix sp.]|nr:CPBP family intramembrane metalloprotease [Kouleothrix sp.]
MLDTTLDAPAVAKETRLQQLRRALITPALSSRAAWCFAGLWLLAALVLIAIGHGTQVVLSSASLVGFLLFSALTVLVTEPPAERAAPVERRSLWLQVAITLVFIAITGYTALAFHNLIAPQAAAIPLWTPLVEWFGGLGERFLPVEVVGSPFNVVANPLKYFILPLLALLLAGARPRDLGFARGHRSWRVIALWCAIPAAVWIVGLASGALTPARLGRRLLSNAFQNGFFEEFLFRGALQTRLSALWDREWALVAQALVFGLWHLGADARLMDGDIVAGLAATIVIQATMGLGFGLMFQRTRNLLASSAAHVAINSL